MSNATPDQPNILLFLTDDHGAWAARTYGTRELHTPSMDYLANHGARFDRAYTPSPVCSPARACVHTGRIPSCHGIHDWLSESKSAIDHPALADQTLLGSRLQKRGYETAQVGKWHCGRSWEAREGFDLWAASSQGPHFGQVHMYDHGEEHTHHGYHTRIVTDRALQFLRERSSDKPFFMAVGYTDTHSPFSQMPPRLVEHYRQCAFDAIPDETPAASVKHEVVPKLENIEEERERLAQYYAAVTHIDEHIGQVLDHLASTGQLDNTLVIYSSDHGHMNGHHGLWCKGNATVPQNFYEESILVPLLASWPARFKGGQTFKQPVDHCDLFATILDAAGADVPAECQDAKSPGQSWLSLVQDDKAPWRDLQFCEYGNARMVRNEQYKLIRRYEGPNGHYPDEFYNLQDDPRERENVIDHPEHTDAIADLDRQLQAYFARWEDPAVAGTHVGDQPRCNAGEPWNGREAG